jgi:serine/threonine-protein kinase RIO1
MLITKPLCCAGEAGEEECEAVAVKIFKTSILVFKDRQRYVTGDWRFKDG